MERHARQSKCSNEREYNVSLTSHESMGGVNAQSGFILQANYALTCLCEWLDDATEPVKFESMLSEGIGDIEANFRDTDGNLHKRFFQVKGGKISMDKFAKIVQSQFYRVEKGAPHTYDDYWLVADALSDRVRKLGSKLQRLQGTGDFYETTEVLRQTVDAIKPSLPSAIAGCDELAEFVAQRVRLDTGIADARDPNLVRDRFVYFLVARRGMSPSSASACYFQLAEIVRTIVSSTSSRRVKTLKRETIEQLIEQHRQADAPDLLEQAKRTEPALAMFIPHGTIQLCHREWNIIRQSLRTACGTTLCAKALENLLDQILGLLDEPNLPTAEFRPWISWTDQTEKGISELATLHCEDQTVSVLQRQAVDLLARQLIIAAQCLSRGRKWNGASLLAHLALGLDPHSISAIEVKKLAQSNLDRDQGELDEMYSGARKALESGRLEDAKYILQSILRRAPWYYQAKLLLEQLQIG